jgi:hypothetical protein
VRAELVGGPFDGDHGDLTVEPPPALYIRPCRTCGSHWFSDVRSGGERYDFDEERDGTAWYVWRDVLSGGGKRTHERELVPA